jgi:hypothetical protein
MTTQASRTVTLTVSTQFGTAADARRVLRDVIDEIRATDMAYLSCGAVTVKVGRPTNRKGKS